MKPERTEAGSIPGRFQPSSSQATQSLKETKKPVAAAIEDAIRQGATSPQLVALTGMSTQAIRNVAERIGVDIRVKAPTVGPEAEARKQAHAK